MTKRNIYLEDIPLEEAQIHIHKALQEIGKWSPLSGEVVSLSDALGRVTSEPIWAKLSSPHYHTAAMDGYAVMAQDTLLATETRPVTLRVDEQAIAVNTGDPLPLLTNAVIMIEHVQPQGEGKIVIRASVPPWQHVRLMGEDMVATELVLPINHVIRPVDLGAIAGCGHHEINVRRKPDVVIIPTGSELVPVTQTPKAGEIIEYNSLMLRAQMLENGAGAQVTKIIPDKHENLLQALRDTIEQKPDLILMLSGSSAGSKDFTASIIQELGILLLHGVAVRPGHPVIMGVVENIPVFGIPGYPVSAILTGEIFVTPIIRQWLGIRNNRPETPTLSALMTRKLTSPIGDDDFVRVTVAQVGDRWLATPLQRGAGMITSLVNADGLVHIPRFSEGVNQGQDVNVSLLRSIKLLQQSILHMGSHDPMLALLAQYLAVHATGFSLTSANVGSMGGLIALKRQEAHLAGIHLLDSETGKYNHWAVEKYLPNAPVQLVTFAHREQGLMIQKGNPQNIESIADLPRVRYVNRQRGAGTRVLLDFELEKQGMSGDLIGGYQHEEFTHLAVAAAVASGLADCGMGVRSAAIAMDLDFVSIGWERFDLVVPEEFIQHDGIVALISILQSKAFQIDLANHEGYDTQQTGFTQTHI